MSATIPDMVALIVVPDAFARSRPLWNLLFPVKGSGRYPKPDDRRPLVG